jgi:hypothetical protein
MWTAHVDGSQVQHWTTWERAFLEAPLPDGIIWREIQPNTSKGAIYVGQTGSPARLLTKRAWGSLGWLPASDTTSDAFYISLMTRHGDDGVWRFPLDGSDPTRVLPALPRSFERDLLPMSVAVSDDGTKIARTFAAGDIDMGGSDWVAQILDGERYWEASIGRVLDFAADDQLVILMRYGWGVYDLQTRKRHLDSRDWFEFPTASPDGRFVATLASENVTLVDRMEGTSLDVSLPSFDDYEHYWLTNDALVLEERSGNVTGVGHHLVVDLRTGWYRLFDTVDPPLSNP